MSDLGTRPLGRKSYGSIGHLPGSRVGPMDHHIHDGQAKAMLESLPRGDWLVVQEKLDGSNVGVIRLADEIVAVQRAGFLATSSPYPQHHYFAEWVRLNADRFRSVLHDGERVAGEFDWFRPTGKPTNGNPHGEEALIPDELHRRNGGEFILPHVVHDAPEACPLSALIDLKSKHGAADGVPEGFVYRWMRGGRLLMRAKWVRPEKVDGCYLDAGQEHWHWRPEGLL